MIKRLKTIFKGKRIVEVDSKFIPQVRVRSGVMYQWIGIYCAEYGSGPDFRVYDDWADQVRNCGASSAQQASIILYNYLEALKRSKRRNKKILHEVDPEAWVKLKQE
ncbi:MAG TPA: hypothetical protein VFM18_18915 [Methanosarcina sp.]|nr:hypothetical protein [Methanosarcina sp.]